MSDQFLPYENGIVFASCNRQNLPQDFWQDFVDRNVSRLMWLGDSVYSYPFKRGDASEVDGLRSAYEELMESKYSLLARRAGMDIDGIWDDHDYGVNDAGRDISHYNERKELFEKFMLRKKIEISSPSDSTTLYKTKVYRLPVHGGSNNQQTARVRVIYLDTRSYRDPHFFPRVGEYESIPYMAYIAALSRCASSYIGLADSYHSGDILGEEQWSWLENILLESNDISIEEYDFNIIASSIQVSTTNCIVESWGHFPQSKRKLFSLLSRSKLKGLMILSGDVHHGELAGGVFNDQHYELPNIQDAASLTNRIIEVTSSGMTHSCSNCYKGQCNASSTSISVCNIVLDTFNRHRSQPKSYFALPNYGFIFAKYDTHNHESRNQSLYLNISVLDIHNHNIVLSVELKSAVSQISPNYEEFPTFWNVDNTIVHINYAIYSTIVLLLISIWLFSRMKP